MGKKKKTSEMAVHYLLRCLSDGIVPARKILTDGIREGYTRDQLKIAKKMIGVKSFQKGGMWWWNLTEKDLTSCGGYKNEKN